MPFIEVVVVVTRAGGTEEIRFSVPPAAPVMAAVELALRTCGINPAGVSWTARLGDRVVDQSQPLSAIAEGAGAVRLDLAVNRNILEETDFEESLDIELGFSDRLCEMGRYAEALSHYEESLRLGATQPEVYSRAATSASRSGDPGRAYGLLKAAESELPARSMTAEMHYHLGRYAARVSRPDEALRHLRIAAKWGYADPEVYHRDTDLASLREVAGFRELIDGL